MKNVLAVIGVVAALSVGCAGQTVAPPTDRPGGTPATSSAGPTQAATDAPADTAEPTPAEAALIADLRASLPQTIKDGGYGVDRFRAITITDKTITIDAKHSNWVRSIMESDAFDLVQDVTAAVSAETSWRPTLVIRLQSALDSATLTITTPGAKLDAIAASSDPVTTWHKASKFLVKGTLY